MNSSAQDWQGKAVSFLVPTTKIERPVWLEIWQNAEKRRFRQLSRLFFIVSAIAYIVHFFFIDLRAGKEPLELWASYRFGLAGLSVIGYLLSFSNRFCASRYFKLPVMIACVLFSYLQAKSMLWHAEIPYFYAFLIPCLTTVILRFNLLTSVSFLSFIHAMQLSSFLQSGIETPILLSALTISFAAVFLFRANMLSDINAFLAEQEKAEMKDLLQEAYLDGKQKEIALAKSNNQLLRKNQVFRTMLESSTNLHHFLEVKDLLQYAAKEFESLFSGCGFLLILADREGQRLYEFESINIDSDLKLEMITNYSRLLDEDYRLNLQSQIASRNHDDSSYPCNTVDATLMVSTADKISGTAVMIGVRSESDSKETIELFLSLVTNCAENLALTKRLEQLAHTDTLTSTFNRYYFDRELCQQIEYHKVYKLHFCLVLVDVNGLKQINDSYGHVQGDNLIVKVSSVLKSTCRKTDIVCRLGGDEFTIICPGTKDPSPLLEKIRHKEKTLTLDFWVAEDEYIRLPIRMSIGVASTVQHPREDLLKIADKRMYEDKREYYRLKA